MEVDNENYIKASFWQEKPFWCQPWSIILTGIFIVILSVIWPHNFWLTTFISFVILIWWLIFLILAPRLYDSIEE